jgi:hypothetical protein
MQSKTTSISPHTNQIGNFALHHYCILLTSQYPYEVTLLSSSLKHMQNQHKARNLVRHYLILHWKRYSSLPSEQDAYLLNFFSFLISIYKQFVNFIFQQETKKEKAVEML